MSDSPSVDVAALVASLREMNAATNSVHRACREFYQLLVDSGVSVLHGRPGEEGRSDRYYWYYDADKDGLHFSARRDVEAGGKRAIIVEAPAPGEEFLPRLESRNA